MRSRTTSVFAPREWRSESHTWRSRGRSRMPRSSSSGRPMIDVAYVALGSNVGDRHGYLATGRTALAELPNSRIIGESSIEETEPIGPVAQQSFLNQMVALETELSPRELLTHLLSIE